MTTQTIQFESVSLSEVGSGTLTAFLFSGPTLSATLASIAENGTLKGRYTGTVEDIAAGDYRLVVKFDGYTVSEPDEAVSLLLAVGTYVSKRYAVLDTGGLLTALGLDAGNLDEQLAAILEASGGGGGGGALTTEQNALLVAIAQWAARNNGGPMHYTGNVGDGGVLELTIGDDHETVMENDLPIVVKDPGGLCQARLSASGSTLSWSAGQDGVGGLLTGNVSTPTYNSSTGLTTIVVQVPNCAAAGNITAPYQWQLKRTAGGKIKTELRGTLRLNADMS